MTTFRAARFRDLATVGVVAGAGLLLAGCGVVGADPSGDPLVEPSSPAPATLGPIIDPPGDSRQVSGAGYTLSAPSEFEQTERPGPGGVSVVVLGTASDRSGAVVEVIAFREEDPESTAEEQMYLLSGVKELAGGSVTRESLDWPDATAAVLVRWDERTTTAQGELTQRFAQLAVQTKGGDIVTAIAVAPVEEFDDSGAMEVLRTLTLDGA